MSGSMLSPHASTMILSCVNMRSAAALDGCTRTTRRIACFQAGKSPVPFTSARQNSQMRLARSPGSSFQDLRTRSRFHDFCSPISVVSPLALAAAAFASRAASFLFYSAAPIRPSQLVTFVSRCLRRSGSCAFISSNNLLSPLNSGNWKWHN